MDILCGTGQMSHDWCGPARVIVQLQNLYCHSWRGVMTGQEERMLGSDHEQVVVLHSSVWSAIIGYRGRGTSDSRDFPVEHALASHPGVYRIPLYLSKHKLSINGDTAFSCNIPAAKGLPAAIIGIIRRLLSRGSCRTLRGLES